MTPQEAFKIGFLKKCAADGLAPDETMQRIQHARFMIKSGGAVSGGLNLLKSMFGAMWPLALLGPPMVGMGGGALLAKAQNDAYEPEEARQREEIAEYERSIDRLRRLQARQQAATGLS